MDMSGPSEITYNYAGKAVSHVVVVVLRLQDTSHHRSLLLPWVKTLRTKAQGDPLKATEAIFDDISAIPVKGIPLKNRVLRVHTSG